jgi:hypothetical protein
MYLHIRSVKKGTVLIDSSTVDPDVSKTVAATAEAQGSLFLDAPVSGGEVLAHYHLYPTLYPYSQKRRTGFQETFY